MPKMYDSIKASLIAKGVNPKSAEASAARIYNSQRPEGAEPVGRNYDRTNLRPPRIPSPNKTTKVPRTKI